MSSSANDIERLFESAEAVLQGAFDRQASFMEYLQQDFDAIRPEYAADNNMKKGYTIYRVSLHGRPSAMIRKRAYDIVNDARNALDQAVFAASIAFGNKKPYKTKTYFPFAKDEEDFALNLFDPKKGNCRDVPVELRPTLHAMRPWWSSIKGDGNDVLRTLGKVSGPNKHQVILEIGPDIIASGSSFHVGKDNLYVFDPPYSLIKLKEEFHPSVMGFFAEVSIQSNRADFIQAVSHLGGEFESEVKVRFNYVATDAKHIPKTPINRLLRTFCEESRKSVEGIKAFCIKTLVT